MLQRSLRYVIFEGHDCREMTVAERLFFLATIEEGNFSFWVSSLPVPLPFIFQFLSNAGFLMPLINDLVQLGQGQMPQLEDYDPALAERTEIQRFNILQLSIVRGHFSGSTHI